MPEVKSGGVRISYDVVGDGRPLVLLHGWCGDRSWWTEPGYVDALRSDHRLLSVDIRGTGASDRPHEAAAYTADTLTGDVFAVADAEGLDRFAVWGQSYGGRIAWMAAAAAPERVAAIVTSGFLGPATPARKAGGDRRVGRGPQARRTSELVDRFKIDMGETFDREFPPWAQAVALHADPEALLASPSSASYVERDPGRGARVVPRPGAAHRRRARGRGRRRRESGRDDPQRSELAAAGPRTHRGMRRERPHSPHRPSVPRPLVCVMFWPG